MMVHYRTGQQPKGDNEDTHTFHPNTKRTMCDWFQSVYYVLSYQLGLSDENKIVTMINALGTTRQEQTVKILMFLQRTD